MRMRTLLLTTTALMPIVFAPALAGPEGGTVVGGAATISGQGSSHVIVNQSSQNAIVNWNTFNVGTGERAQFIQPNSSSAILNRVTGGLGPSQILGSIDANGRVFIVNRDGIIFGPGAVINTAGFLATTSDIKNSDFMAGSYHFNIPGRPDASIVNQGTITATSGGFAALVAPGVRNSGTITANLGTVTLAAGNTFSLDFYGDKLITLGVNDQIAGQVKDVVTGETLKSLVTNTGKLQANGGRVELTAAAARHVVDSVINTSGVVEANSVQEKSGEIVLSAATASTKGGYAGGAGLPTQTVKISGKLSAAGRETGTKGGKIVVTGENIEIANAKIDASGRAGGGKVMIGGDWAGGKPNAALVNNQSAKLEGNAIPTATTVSVDAASVIDASARDGGHGGKVVLWSDDKTTFAGTILALGGKQFGNGGFVETSGRKQLSFTGNVNTSAPNGKSGTLLLDPEDYTIWDGIGPLPSGSSMTNTALQLLLASNNVLIATNNSGEGGNGDIFVNAPVTWSANTLTLSAYRDIVLPHLKDGPNLVGTGSASLVMRADNTGSGTGTILMPSEITSARIDWTASSGTIAAYYNPATYDSPTSFTTPSFGGYFNAAPSQLTAYMLVNSVGDLQRINNNLAGTYALGRNIDARSVSNFAPLGTFTGILDGHGGLGTNHTISNLTIAPTTATNSGIGLFSSIGSFGLVQNLTIANATVTASPQTTNPEAPPVSAQSVGILAGFNNGMISNVTVSGTVSDGPSTVGTSAGGLVGTNAAGASISNSWSEASVTLGSNSAKSTSYAGGLAGTNFGIITTSRATGAVTIAANFVGGGFVGLNGGSIEGASKAPTAGQACVAGQSCATGAVSANAGGTAGGLVGSNIGVITNAFATGAVTGEDSDASTPVGVALGGLAGRSSGTITGSHASGHVSATFSSGLPAARDLGGLVGANAGAVSGAFATGTVSSTYSGSTLFQNLNIGGLLGSSTGTVSNSYAGGAVTSTVSASGTSNNTNAGGLIGLSSAAVSNSHATGDVTSNNSGGMVGGLIGLQQGATVSGSYATGAVSVTLATGSGVAANVGGLIGSSSGNVTTSRATGNVNIALDSSYLGYTAGGLIGSATGSISDSHATGNVATSGIPASTPYSFYFGSSGGLVGSYSPTSSDAAITNSYATGNVTGVGHVGGLVGSLFAGQITNSYATGNITGLAPPASSTSSGYYFYGATGGLVGYSTLGQIAGSYATGNVTGHGDVGGLVGNNFGNITSSYASGQVTGLGSPFTFTAFDQTTNTTRTYTYTPSVGGLVGQHNVGTIADSRASGNVTGIGFVGGLAGQNDGLISNSYATGHVTGPVGPSTPMTVLGGLAGVNTDTITNSWSSGRVQGGDTSLVGGLVGINYAATISLSHSLSQVSTGANGIAGGLAGANFGSIDRSSATGSVNAGASGIVGGFVGVNYGVAGLDAVGRITQSYATGTTTGGANSTVAAFAGQNNGYLDQTYGTGLVTAGAGSTTGGLVAVASSTVPPALQALIDANTSSSTSTTASAAAAVTPSTALVVNSFWDTQSTGQTQSAGGAGYTTAQLLGALPPGFSTIVWEPKPAAYPALTGQSDPPTKPPSPPNDPGQQPVPPDPPQDPPQQPQSDPQPQPTPQAAPATTTPQASPQLAVTAQLVGTGPTNPPPAGEGINLQGPPETGPGSGPSGSAPGAGGSSGGSGNAPGGAPPSATNNPNSAGRPSFTSIPSPGLGVLPSGLPPLTETRFASNEVVMQLGTNLSPERIAEIARTLGLEIISQHTIGLLGRTVYRFRITRGQSVRDAIVALESNGATVAAQPSYTFTLSQTEMAGRSRRGDSAQYIVAKLALTEAHGIATGKGVKVAVIDSEIDAQHPDLKGAVTGNYDALPSSDQNPHPHGTGMAGAIGSHQRLLGVAPGAQILGIRAFGVSDAGAQGTSMNIVKGLEWAVKEGAQVINMSFAGPRDPILEQAIRGLKDKGIILIAAAGNAGPKSPPLFPAADPNVIAVSATDVDDRTYRNAVRGKHVAIAAPGVDILVPAPEGGYQLTTGTSVAAAHISGVVAMLLERNSRLTPAEMRSILASSAKKLPQSRNEVGAGLVDPVQALAKAAPKSVQVR